MSSSGKTKVILFGSTGTLGAALLAGLTSPDHGKHFAVTVVVRNETLESKEEKKIAVLAKVKAAGATIVGGNITAPPAELAKIIAGHEVVLSALAYPNFLDQLKLIEASKLAGTVKFFIPSEFGFNERVPVENNPVPVFVQKRDVVKAVQESGLNYILIHSSLFTEYLFSPFGGIDLANGTITAPGSFDAKVSTTTLKDIGLLTAEAILQREQAHVKNQHITLVGDTVSFAQIATLLEEHLKKPLKKEVKSKADNDTEIAADTSYQNWTARFRSLFIAQTGVFLPVEESWNHKHAKHLPAQTLHGYIHHHIPHGHK